ncbi:hypothetical protein LAG90_16585 [Marinilongibacter aquaticus]|uniref:OmpP1/FadL family transporter n=1 Tax=Marinilongibacter aquaticus TaxID=2975157 RepID=UPI0021BDD66D|nr:hypothetical protein [Marinilongibacter aquaticus]UBM58421.1 hypothetical protein LAG90_16585 [Marinilongibacter aquaticus]
MKKLWILVWAIAVPNILQAQQLNLSGHFYGEDAFKFSNYDLSGSARARGMGGAFTALGGDASSALINPAGLGFFNRSEVSISPVFSNQSTSTSYINNTQGLNSSNVSLGHFAAVFGNNRSNGKKKSSAFAISFHTLVNFKNAYGYSGVNQASSMMDYFAEQADLRGASTETLNSEFDTNSGYAYSPEALYYQSYMINYANDTDGYVVAENSLPVNQSGKVDETGKLSQMNLAYGLNLNDQTYLGASLGIQTLNYDMISTHDEAFPDGEFFNGFSYTDELLVKGTGVNLSLGVIQRLTDDLRLGVNLTTPTMMKTQETYYSQISIDDIPNAINPAPGFKTIATAPNDYQYRITSPLRANAGLAYFLPQKIGVFSVEAEYVGYKGMKLKDKTSQQWSTDQNNAVSAFYKDVVNVKAGLELRRKSMYLRGGLNYLGDPYAFDDGVDRSKIVGSAGLGYRSAKFFVDVSFNMTKFNQAYTPYTLSDPTKYASANVDNKNGNLAISVGTFF